MGDASLGSLKRPSPNKFAGAGSSDNKSEYVADQAYFSSQNPRFHDLMNSAEPSLDSVGHPLTADDQTLARLSSNLGILSCTDDFPDCPVRAVRSPN